MRFSSYIFALLLLIAIVSVSSCKKNKLLTDGNARLTFSTDTLTFDTVFTTIGSATRLFKIYNPYNQKVNISRVWLEGGNSSPFRINVDSASGTEFTNIELAAHDSTYVFVAVTVDPNNVNNPMVIYGNVFFEINNNQQSVALQAWGQDAYFHYNEDITSNTFWHKDKPHVILGLGVFIDSLFTLNIDAGTKIYCHAYSHLFVQGALKCNGTVTDTVIFQGDRLERYYDDLPGQWGGIVFLRGAQPSTMTHTVISEGEFGIVMGSLINDNDLSHFSGLNYPSLTMDKCVIKHCEKDGVFTFFSAITMKNCLVYDCGEHCGQFAFGGNTDLQHCTFANYSGVNNSHDLPTLYFSNYAAINSSTIDTRGGYINATNCIIYGNLSSGKELIADDSEDSLNIAGNAPFDYTFTNCLLRTHFSLSGNTHFVNCSSNLSPDFENTSSYIFKLQSTSLAINAGIVIPGITDDLADKARDGQPDMGAFEF